MTDDTFGWLQSDLSSARRRRKGMSVTKILDLPEAQRQLLVEITRREPVSLRELTEALEHDPIELEIQVSQMVAQGWLDVEENDTGEWVYCTRIERRSTRVLPPGIWQAVDRQWQIPIFRLFPEAVLEEFSSSFELEQLGAGTVLFQLGDWGERMYIVEEGRIELQVHNENGDLFVVRRLGAGDVIGETAVLLGERRPFSAHVIEETQVWALSKSNLDALLTRHPVVGLTIRQELSRHLKSASRSRAAKTQYNPVIAVGDGGPALAKHLAQQTASKVLLIDMEGHHEQHDETGLVYINGRTMRSTALIELIQESVRARSWVILATLPTMSDQLMRALNVAELVIDLTGRGAPWLRAAVNDYWVVPSSTPLQMARLARRLCGQVTALVLSGGMARTLAHLGVLDILHNEGIPIDLCASCGYGALWSTLYAAGWAPSEIIEWAVRQGPKLSPVGSRLGIRPLSRLGLFDARSVRGLIRRTIGDLQFSDLETPCYLAASDLDTGQTIWFTTGPLFHPLSACIATPGLIAPIEHQDRQLVDAIMTNPLPADVIVHDDADIVLASSVIPGPSIEQQKRRSQGLVRGWLSLSETTSYQRSLDHLNAVDVLVLPDITGISDLAFDQADILVERGRQAAQAALPRIRALLRGDSV